MRVDIPEYNTFIDFPDGTDPKIISDTLSKSFPAKTPGRVKYSPEIQEQAKSLGRSLTKNVAAFGAETAGLIGGGMKGAALGSTLGPMGIIAGGLIGAGTGYATVKAGENIVEGKPLTALGTAKDITEGALMQSSGALLSKIPAIPGKILSKKTDPGLMRLYEKFNINPLPSEARTTPSKTLSVLESVLGYSPFSGTVMTDYSVTRLGHLNNIRAKLVSKGASEQELAKIGNSIRDEATSIVQKYRTDKSKDVLSMTDELLQKMGVKISDTKYSTGTTMKESLSSNLVNRKAKINEMYASVDDALGNMKKEKISISKETQDAATELYNQEMAKPAAYRSTGLLSKIKAFLPKKSKEGTIVIGGYKYTPEQAMQLPEIIRKAAGVGTEEAPSYTWNGLKGTRTELQDKIRSIYKETGGLGNNESRIYQNLAESVENEMEKFAQIKGDDIWNLYTQARSESRTLHELFDKDTLKIMNAKPQEILNRIVAKNDVDLLKNIKNTLGYSGIQPLKKAYIGDAFNKSMMEMTDKTGARYLTLNTKTLEKEINKLSPEMSSELLSPLEIKSIKNISSRTENINLKAFGRNKNQALQFLDTLTGTSNEKIVTTLFRPENTRNIKLARLLLSPQQYKNVQEAALNKVLKVTAEGNYLPISSAKEVNKHSSTLRELIGKDAFNDVRDFVKITGNMKKVEQMAQNLSQTGQVFVGFQIMQQLVNSPLQAIKTMGMPWAISKIYVSDVARNYLKKSLMYPVNHQEAISNFAKAISVGIKIGVQD